MYRPINLYELNIIKDLLKPRVGFNYRKTMVVSVLGTVLPGPCTGVIHLIYESVCER